MGRTLTDASALLDVVLATMDEELARLQRRLDEDADALREVVRAADVSDGTREALLEVTARIEETAAQVAQHAHRPPDAERVIDALLAEPLSSIPPRDTQSG